MPDLSSYGYQVTEQLNQNLQGGRITYKAIEIATQKPVVIKQFRFATTSDWESYREIEREIEVLQGLNHPGIPRYLTQFDPGDGLCLVQEYKAAQPLSNRRSFSPQEVKSIAIQLLEILVYLQERIPPIFHRDIKPENVLVEIPPAPPLKKGGEMKAYLIDFGLARIGNSTMAMSSMMGGTLGFMPPEQVHNQRLIEASDLYGLGATLICLMTQTKSTDIGSLVDFSTNKITFRDRVPQFSLRFIQWLEKMVEPNPANRYQNAKMALEALKPLDLIRIPEVNLDKLELTFVASSVDKKLSQTIKITNTTPDTTLQGQLSVSPHPKDPPHTPDSHRWIRFSPQEFKGNQVECVVTVDTSQLRADRNYEREIVLSSNAIQENYYLKIRVRTAAIQLNVPLPPYLLIAASGLVVAVISGVLLQGNLWVTVEAMWEMASENFLFGVMHVAIFGAIFGVIFGAIRWAIRWAIGEVVIGCWAIGEVVIGLAIFGAISLAISFGIGLAISGVILEVIDNILQKNFYNRGFNERTVALYVLLTTATGILTGVGAVIGFNSYLLMGLGVSALPLAGMLIAPQLKLRRLKAQHRHQESQNLIEP